MTSDRDTDAREGAERPVHVASATRVDPEALPGHDFTYAVLPSKSPGGGERRAGLRQRTRLRSGKLVRRDGQFLCECLITNRSSLGCRLKLPSTPPELQEAVYFYDDQTELLFLGRVAWRKERELGLRLSPCTSNRLHISIVGAMRRKYYAVKR